jgi:hypothetical protein
MNKRPYETIWGIEDHLDGTVTIYSNYDLKHPECPIKIIENYKNEK